jgi:hypothetical protein
MVELLTLALFPLIGSAVAIVLRIAVPEDLPARSGLFFLLGSGMLGALLFITGVLGFPPYGSALAVCAVSAGVLAFGVARKLPRIERGRSRCASPWPLVVLVLPFACVLAATTILPLSDYDGRVTWLPKAQAIVAENSITGPFFRGERGLNLHNRYPLLVPLDAATLMRISGEHSERAIRWLYALLPLAFLLYARDAVPGAAGPWIAAGVAWLPMVIVAPEGSAVTAYSDLAVMAFAGGAVLATVDGTAALTACWMLCLVLTKNEGTIIGAAILAAMIVLRPAKKVWAAAAAAFVAGALTLRAWWSYVPAAYDERYDVLVRHLPARLYRVGEAAHALGRHALQWTQWGAFWIAVAVGLIVIATKARTKNNGFLAAVLLLSLSAYVIAFTVTSWSFEELATVAADRLLTHLLGPACAIIAAAWAAIPDGPPAARRASPRGNRPLS